MLDLGEQDTSGIVPTVTLVGKGLAILLVDVAIAFP